MAVAIITGAIVSLFASKNPDGLEWAIAKVTGKEELKGPEQGLHGILSAFQKKTAFLPDYAFKKTVDIKNAAEKPGGEKKKDEESKLGTSVSGILGGLMTLAIVFLTGSILRKRNQPVRGY